MKGEHPGPNDPEWPQWATLCNDVADCFRAAEPNVLFSGRQRAAQVLWDAGYRPTEEAIARVRARQKAALV